MTKFALVFAGQGKQAVGMMVKLAEAPVIRQTFIEASDAIGIDLWAMVTAGSADALNLTINTQPVMLAAGVATYRLWLERGGRAPQFFAGHSLGEYSALVAGGAIKFSDAAALVRFRANAMQDAVPEGVGAIAVVLGLDADAVRKVCLEAAGDEVVEAVNLNSPEQIVIAGNRAAIERAMVLAKAQGAKRAMLLPMSVPSHCALMKPAAARLAEYLKTIPITAPSVPVIQNADVTCFQSAEQIRQALVEQLFRPVRWIETIRHMKSAGVHTVVECVPGKVLTGLNKRIEASLACLDVSDMATLDAAIAATAHA